MRRYLPLLLVVTLGGCTTVRVPEPFGDTPVALVPGDWNGTWCEPDVFEPVPGTNTVRFDPAACLNVTVADPVAGVLDVLVADDPRPQHLRVYLRLVGDESHGIFVTVEEGGQYEFVQRLTRDGNHIVAWDLSDGIQHAIEASRLPGGVVDSETVVEPLTAGDVRRIALDEHGEYFNWSDPTVYVHVDGIGTPDP